MFDCDRLHEHKSWPFKSSHYVNEQPELENIRVTDLQGTGGLSPLAGISAKTLVASKVASEEISSGFPSELILEVINIRIRPLIFNPSWNW